MASGVRQEDTETRRQESAPSSSLPPFPTSHLLRVGILGGTFDPPHNGHLLLGRAARDQLGLDKVLFAPVGDPTHKTRTDLTSATQRVAMTALAIGSEPSFTLDLTDMLRPEPHYTATLLPLIQSNHPNAELWLVIGGDSLRDFHKWYQPEQVLTYCRLAVLPRPGAEIDWQLLTERFPNIRDRVDMLAGTTLALSSTMLRQFPANERDAHIPAAVARYIDHSQLYAAAGGLAI